MIVEKPVEVVVLGRLDDHVRRTTYQPGETVGVTRAEAEDLVVRGLAKLATPPADKMVAPKTVPDPEKKGPRTVAK